MLLRRVYLDLIGLPPTRDELHAFLADPSDAAYEQVVDRLLASPQYGERWARHWMDVWRYSDWYGRRAVPDVLEQLRQIWRWRDWIVAVAQRRQRLRPHGPPRCSRPTSWRRPTTTNLVATGFLVRNWYRWNYNPWMKDNVEHTGKAFLGLTFNCAHCHDHKYDPITQEDYFALPRLLRADRDPPRPRARRARPGALPEVRLRQGVRPDHVRHGPRLRREARREDVLLHRRRVAQHRRRQAAGPAGRPGVPGRATFRVEPVSLPAGGVLSRPEGVRPPRGARRSVAADVARLRAGRGRHREGRRASRSASWNEAELARARAGLEALEARIAADRVRFGKQPGDAAALSRAAARAERRGGARRRPGRISPAPSGTSRPRRKKASPTAAKPAELTKAEQQLAAARQAVDAAIAALARPSDRVHPAEPDLSREEHRPARGPGPLDQPPRQSADRPRGGQPHLAVALRPAARRLDARLRPQRQAAHAPGLARLAGGRADGAGGWSMKAMHRLIVTSAAYRMASHPSDPRRSEPRDRSGEPRLLALPPRADGGRGRPRQPAARRRRARPDPRRPRHRLHPGPDLAPAEPLLHPPRRGPDAVPRAVRRPRRLRRLPPHRSRWCRSRPWP